MVGTVMEEPVQFICNNKRLYGILHIPDSVVTPATIMIILTGGPQVRTGGHRLYVHLSRFLCEHNVSTFRFDYEGSGDSEGDFVGFQHAGPSLAAAIHFLHNRFKNELNVIIWSLCDGAAAAALYAATNQEYIRGLILCNPFVITEQGVARSNIKHYYSKRFFDKEFLCNLICFRLNFKRTIKSLLQNIIDAQFFTINKTIVTTSNKKFSPALVFDSLQKIKKPIRVILSTDDIVAANFQDELKKNKAIKNDYKKNKIINSFIKGAGHTFVDPSAKEKLFSLTLQSVNEIESIGSANVS
ncbi:hypothetical protein MNBD_DELTA04-1628 [hydrothermal vent metagenome]|uniref:Serine aminopeptidase S33 domain-containing protein n=1 Tax=hydrothermal vent metagenome TaxID=652676 RepID=A0A3B0V1B6_9ZZZZ